ncbi:MAG: hypothetical protein J6V44_13560 [Methanobrevibacter sp.]|nr:hypothetical protein [Methanobrevibacter sp.]
MVKAKRLLTVSLVALTLFSFGIGFLSVRTFTLLSWLILSLQIEFGIFIFALTVIGIILGYCWATDGDEDETFIGYSKDFIESMLD